MKIKTIQENELLITSDIMFAYAMQNKEICKGVLERILGRGVSKISYPEGQKTIKELLTDKSIRLDVYFVEDDTIKHDIEMQSTNTGNLPKRTRYYHAKIDGYSLRMGEDYNLLNESYVIFLCTFALFKAGIPVYTFRKRCLENPDIFLNDDQTTIFVNLTCTDHRIVCN